MKLFIATFTFLLFRIALFAQSNTIDSLLKALKTAPHDTTRLRLLVELSEECEPTDILKYTKPAVELADKLLQNKSIKNFTKIKNLKASALNNIGYIYNNQGQTKEALDYYGRSLNISEETGDKLGIAYSYNNIGFIYDNQGQMKEALDYYDRSLKLYEEIGDKQGIALSLNNIGTIYDNQGQVKEALDYFGRSLSIREETDDKRGISYSLNSIGFIYNNQGQVKEALGYFGRSLKLREEIGDKQGIANSLSNIGFIYNNQGLVKEALGYYDRSLKLHEEIGDKQGIANSLSNIGGIYNNQGQLKEVNSIGKFSNGVNPVERESFLNRALDYYDQSLKLREEIGDKQGIANSLSNIGAIYKNQGQVKEVYPVKRDSLFNRALDYYGRSLKLNVEIGYKQGIAYSLNNIGEIYLQQKNYLLSLSYSDSSLSLAKKLGYPENIRNAELTLAQIDSARGNPAGAFEHYKSYIVYRDSIKNKENEKAAIRQQTKYEFEKALLVKEQEEKEKKRILVATVERRDRIQYSVTLIVIVVLLSFVMLIGKIKVNQKVAEGLIFFVFLILFEFILVLADPYIENFTGGAPGYKLLFNAIIAALIFPLHAFFEKKLKRRLMKQNTIEHG